LSAIVKVPVKAFRPKQRCELRSDTTQVLEHGNGAICLFPFGRQKLIALRLDHFDLLDHQFKTVKFSRYLGFQERCERPTIASAKLFEARSSIAIQRSVSRNSLCEQKSLNSVDVRQSLDNQGFPFPDEPTPVFLVMGWNPNHRTCSWLTPFERHKCADECFSVDTIGFSSARFSGHRYRCRIHHMALNTFVGQDAMDPEPIKACLLDNDHGEPRIGLTVRPGAELGKQAEQPSDLAGWETLPRHFGIDGRHE
jgi:hypothetical protein